MRMFIREMAQRTRISDDTLRFYERIGLLPPVPRSRSGVRQYSEYHVQYVALIQSLKASGMSLEEIQHYMELARRGQATAGIRKRMVVAAKHKLQQQIARLQQSVAEADFQLRHYETSLLKRTNRMACSYPKEAGC